jgi:uncharacterized protein YjbJ (UPF0337 family)
MRTVDKGGSVLGCEIMEEKPWASGTRLKGRVKVKEALGDLAENDKLKKEGSIDRATGRVNDAVDKVADKAAGKD